MFPVAELESIVMSGPLAIKRKKKKKTGIRGLAKYELKVNTTNTPEGNDFCEFFAARLNRSATTTHPAVIASV